MVGLEESSSVNYDMSKIFLKVSTSGFIQYLKMSHIHIVKFITLNVQIF